MANEIVEQGLICVWWAFLFLAYVTWAMIFMAVAVKLMANAKEGEAQKVRAVALFLWAIAGPFAWMVYLMVIIYVSGQSILLHLRARK